jgi:peptide/nickel transport system ATP-binding protein
MNGLEVTDLRVELAPGGADVIDGISLTLPPGKILGVVGESGSGKTTLALALLGHARRGTRIARGSVKIDDQEMLFLSDERARALRGRRVAYIPQDPGVSLNPAIRVGDQIEEILIAHAPRADDKARAERIRETLAEVKLPADREFLRRYPHQLSGGQQQRIAIAMAFVLRPRVIVLDEPTTGLDVTTQAHVLETVRALCKNHEVAALYVTHDLSVISSLADRLLVMYAGRVAEEGPTRAVFERAAHPYTARLIAAIPDIGAQRALTPIAGHAPSPGKRPEGCFFAPRCPAAISVCSTDTPPAVAIDGEHAANCHRAGQVSRPQPRPVDLVTANGAGAEAVLSVRDLDVSYGSKQVVHGVSLDLSPHECVALVGESGSGKTTLSRTIIGLLQASAGELRFEGQPLAPAARARPVAVRRGLQYIFQNPYASLNPRRTVEDSIATPIRHFFDVGGGEARKRVDSALERVSLNAAVAQCYPDELSGGERQRVAIARALACEPVALICDEVTSALDASVQAAIVELLRGLVDQDGLSILFVTHNLALVRSLAHRVVVLRDGSIVEQGPTTDVLVDPADDYTRTLLADTPRIPAVA